MRLDELLDGADRDRSVYTVSVAFMYVLYINIWRCAPVPSVITAP